MLQQVDFRMYAPKVKPCDDMLNTALIFVSCCSVFRTAATATTAYMQQAVVLA